MKLTFKAKLIAACLVAITIVAATLTWISSNKLYEHSRQSIYARAGSVGNTEATAIHDWLDIRKTIVASTAKYLTESEGITLLHQARESGDFMDVYIGKIDGQFISAIDGEDLSDYDPRTRSWYSDALSQNKMVVSSAYKDAMTGQLLVTISQPISQNGTLVGVLGADVLIDTLINEVIDLDVGENAHLLLLDTSNNSILAHYKSELAQKPVNRLSNELTMSNIQKAERENSIEIFFDESGQEKLIYFKGIVDTNWILAMEMDRATEESGYYSLLGQLIITAFIITVVLIIGVSALVSHLFKDLLKVSRALEEISNGKGDLTQRLQPTTDDEIGDLAINFNSFVENMHKMMLNINEVSTSLAQQAQESEHQANQRNVQIGRQQDEIQMVATAIHEMSIATQEIAGNAERTAENANEAVNASVHGGQQMGKTQQSIETLASEVHTATTVIAKLKAHGDSINSILSTIQGIAEQTNLLALNAAIEAARAGEQGRGFAVVADEVRVLSQRTHASTQEIQQTIELLQSTTNEAVTIMGDSQTLAHSSVEDATNASVSINQINTAVELINDMASQIATAAEEQASVTEEITKNTEGIRDASNSLSDASALASQQAGELSGLSHQLQQQISQFKL